MIRDIFLREATFSFGLSLFQNVIIWLCVGIELFSAFNQLFLDEFRWPFNLKPDQLVVGIFNLFPFCYKHVMLLLGLLLIEEPGVIFDCPIFTLFNDPILERLPSRLVF